MDAPPALLAAGHAALLAIAGFEGEAVAAVAAWPELAVRKGGRRPVSTTLERLCGRLGLGPSWWAGRFLPAGCCEGLSAAALL